MTDDALNSDLFRISVVCLSEFEKIGGPASLLFGLFGLILGWTINQNEVVLKIRIVRSDRSKFGLDGRGFEHRQCKYDSGLARKCDTKGAHQHFLP